MKIMTLVLASLVSLPAFALVDVSFKCTPKAFGCFGGPNGPDCLWNDLGPGRLTTIPLERDPRNRNVWRARYQDMIDGHALTVDFRYNAANERLRVNAFLAVTNVMAETSGDTSIDIALRNASYGRGYTCNQIRIRD